MKLNLVIDKNEQTHMEYIREDEIDIQVSPDNQH